jgi:peptidoglycan/LPS O-acetylase OafA/YrhL
MEEKKELKKSSRNYTIDLFRFIFSIGFVFGHLSIILGRLPGRENATKSLYALDTLAVFICIAGYFMMRSIRRACKDKDSSENAVALAWTYLKSRIRTLGVWFLVGNIGGFIGLMLFTKVPLGNWFDAFLNHLGEFFGLMLTGFNYGTAATPYGTASSEYMLINGPLWFISGLFITSYLLYYLICKNEKKTLGVIIPMVSLVFYGSMYLNGVTMPFWHNFASIGYFKLNLAMIDMFCNLGIGCLMYVAVEKLEGKEFTKTFTWILTILQIFLLIFIPFRTLYPTNGPLNPFTFNWGPAYLLSLIFTFLLVLNRDYATKFLNRKIFGKLGGISMHVYCLHYMVIIILYCIAPEVAAVKTRVYILGVLFITIIISILAKLASPAIDNYLLSKPWFKKEKEAVKE